MNKKIWDLYAPIYERAMRADRKVYQYMYDRIPQIIADKEVLEIATGPGLLVKDFADCGDFIRASVERSGIPGFSKAKRLGDPAQPGNAGKDRHRLCGVRPKGIMEVIMSRQASKFQEK